jgi:hypothetical protein
MLFSGHVDHAAAAAGIENPGTFRQPVYQVLQ